MKYINKLINYGLYLFVFLLPWQTRLIFKDASINEGVFEYGRISLYASEIVLLVVLALVILRRCVEGKLKIVCPPKPERWRGKNSKLKTNKLWVIIFILAIWSVITILWAGDKMLAWYGWFKLMEGIGLFWIVADRAQMTRRWLADGLRVTNGLFISIVSAGVIQSILAIYQFLNQNIVASKWLGMSEIFSDILGASVIEFEGQRWLRAYGSLPHPNILGGFLAICLVIAIISLYQLKHKQKENNVVTRKDFWLTLFYWFSAMLMFYGLIISFSRSAWLGFLVTFGYLGVRSLFKKIKTERTISLYLSVSFLAVLILFFIGFPSKLITTRFQPTENRLEQISISERGEAYGQFNKVIQEHWYKGTGLRNYLLAVHKNQPNLYWWQYQPVHDSGLLALAELGVVGLALFILLLIFILKNRSIYWPLIIGILVIGLFDHYFRSLYFGIMLWWLVLGLTKSKN